MGALFHNYKVGEPIRVALWEMEHPHQATPVHTDNPTAEGISNNNIHKKSTKSMDIRFYWVKDMIPQVQYNLFCKSGATILAKYLTKHHTPHHHCRILPVYLHCPGISYNTILGACYSSQNTSQNKYQSKTQIRKK